MLDHEKSGVYQCSIEFLAIAFEVIEKIPRGYSMEKPVGSNCINAYKNVPIVKDRSRARLRVRQCSHPFRGAGN